MMLALNFPMRNQTINSPQYAAPVQVDVLLSRRAKGKTPLYKLPKAESLAPIMHVNGFQLIAFSIMLREPVILIWDMCDRVEEGTKLRLRQLAGLLRDCDSYGDTE